MQRYSIRAKKQENVIQNMNFYHLQENIKNKYWIQG